MLGHWLGLVIGDEMTTRDAFNQGRCGAICGAFPFPVRFAVRFGGLVERVRVLPFPVRFPVRFAAVRFVGAFRILPKRTGNGDDGGCAFHSHLEKL